MIIDSRDLLEAVKAHDDYEDHEAVDQVDAALADLALEAVATLRAQMLTARAPKDRIAAANSILDRLGYGRTTRAQADVADREIRNALEAAAKTGRTTKALEQ